LEINRTVGGSIYQIVCVLHIQLQSPNTTMLSILTHPPFRVLKPAPHKVPSKPSTIFDMSPSGTRHALLL
jgi:hypothetical protein